MSDNVIILGAGASFDAGIPLLGGFVEKMWELSARGKSDDGLLSQSDKEVLEKALQVKNELDSYHGRAAFDDRNIEDILSILSFNIIGGKKTDKQKLEHVIKAISRTIELSCNVKHNGQLNVAQQGGNPVYRRFWVSLFERFKDNLSLPTIITFNYDLVLERALFQQLINIAYITYPFDGFTLNYHYSNWQTQVNNKPQLNTFSYLVKNAEYFNGQDEGRLILTGTSLIPVSEEQLRRPAPIEILKLHGSLNFPTKKLSRLFPSPLLTLMNPHLLFPQFRTNH
jgi:hypothetical protein